MAGRHPPCGPEGPADPPTLEFGKYYRRVGVRWQHPKGPIPPGQNLPIVEEPEAIGQEVTRQSTRPRARILQRQGQDGCQ
jgi:hypothetical protein